MDIILITALVSILISFFTTLFITPGMKKFLFRIGIVAKDQQKPGRPLLPTSGGILVIAGVLMGGFFFMGVNTFVLHMNINLLYLLAAYCSILIITIIGFVDDINIRAIPVKNKGLEDYRIGLKQWQKPLLTLPAAIPLMVISAGVTHMNMPFLGNLEFGLVYPLILIPLAVVVVSNATNMLAGMNGLETGLGLVSTFSLGVYLLSMGRIEAGMIAFTAAFSLLAFLLWNRYPAKFLPGDSLTYLVGATIAAAVIMGNVEKFGIIIFTPWIIEFFLKLRSGFRARSLGDLQRDGSLRAPYKKIYSLTHLMMKIRPMKERNITLIIVSFEVVMCAIAFLVA
jgi:UDP-N-acetylglucosamine--dolichyl-phosphate N-acetylglucosaminephosphotransferase